MEGKSKEMKGPIFIIGTQRSGTTLLRLILSAHSEIAVPEEASFLMPLLNKKNLERGMSGKALERFIRYLSLNAQFRLWNYDYGALISRLGGLEEISLRELINEIYSSYSRWRGKRIWGDKSPPFFRKLDILHSLFPDARFIHIVRDGRDVFDSWRRADSAMDNAAVTALDWRYKLHRIEKSFDKIPANNRLTVRYEDLLERPEETVRLICVVIGVDYEPGMLEFHKSSHDYIGGHHSTLIFQPIDASNRFKWKKNLTTMESLAYEVLAGKYLRRYNYEITGRKPGIQGSLFMGRGLILGLAHRAFQVIRVKIAAERALRKGAAVDSLSVGKLPKGKGE